MSDITNLLSTCDRLWLIAESHQQQVSDVQLNGGNRSWIGVWLSVDTTYIGGCK